MPEHTAPRERTPPLLKYLLNERAALLGGLARLDAALPELAKQAEAAERKARKLWRQLATAREQHAGHLLSVRALGVTIGLVSPVVNPEAGGVVAAWAGKYGERGAFRKFVLGMLKSAAPQVLSSAVLYGAVVAEFGLYLPTRSQKETIRRNLRRLLSQEHASVERVPGQLPSGALLWRWREILPTLAALAEECGDGSGTHAVGAEMGGQRAGGNRG